VVNHVLLGPALQLQKVSSGGLTGMSMRVCAWGEGGSFDDASLHGGYSLNSRWHPDADASSHP
jgi:hypothetical protein